MVVILSSMGGLVLEEVELVEDRDPTKASRSQTVRGAARELVWIAFNVAVWPLGLVDEAVRGGARRLPNPRQLIPRLRRKPNPEAAQIPIVLVHGYFHNRSGLMVMERTLRKHGFRNVHTFSYNPLRKTIPQISECLAQRIDRIIEKTGADKVHLVGHSLGGLACRYYAEKMGGHHNVATLVTIGTPHHGTRIAHAGRSPAAKQMRPGAEFIRTLESSQKPAGIKYISYHSNLDLVVVPARSAILDQSEGADVRNILVHNLGHLSLLISPELIASIAENLSQD